MDPAQTTAPVPQHVNLYVEGLTEEELMLPVRERLPEWVKDANGNPVEATVTVAADAILKEEMRCSICLGTLTKTLTTACLHRFCSECLKEYLRMLGHEECPECRAKVPTHRSAKDDEKMDAIIDLLNAAAAAQPVSVDEEAAEVKKYKEACFHRKQQIIMKAKHKRQHTEQMQPTSGARPRTTKSQGSVAFTLTPLQAAEQDIDASKNALREPYLLTPRQFTVADLKQYIKIKTGTTATSDLTGCTISTYFQGKFQPLGKNLTIGTLAEKYWDGNCELILYYKFSNDTKNSRSNRKEVSSVSNDVQI